MFVGIGQGGGGALAGMVLVFLAQRGPPSVFSLPWSRSQGILSCVSRAINFSSVFEMTFRGISTLSLGGEAPPLH